MAERRVTFMIGANYENFKKGMESSLKELQKFGRKATRIGRNLTTNITAPIVGIATASVMAFGKQEDAERKLRASLEANGREVDSLFNKYKSFADEMQRLTVVGDETTLAMLQQAESMGLTGEAAQRVVKNAIAMESAFGVASDRALRYTAALEAGEATMLRRYIPSLRGIKDETELATKAQEILNNAFSVAKEEATGTTGQFKQLKNIIGDVSEVVGESVSRAISPYVSKIRDMALRSKNLSPSLFDNYVKYGLIAAALGPAIMLTGKMATAVHGLVVATRALTVAMLKNPYAVVAAAVLGIGVNAWLANKRISDLNESIDMVLDQGIGGRTLGELTELITKLEEYMVKLKRQAGSMGLDDEQYTPLVEAREELEQLIEKRDQLAKSQIDKIISEREPERITAAADAIERVEHSINRLKPVVENVKPISEVIDIEELYQAEQELQKMSVPIHDIVDTWEQFDFSHRLPTEEERKSFTNFAHTGAMMFDRMAFAGARLDDVLKSILRQVATKGFFNLIMGLAGGGFSGGFLNTIFGGFFASGGTLRPGEWGVVGERGPEPIIATPTGAVIIPNHRATSAMASRGGGGPSHAVVNVSIDSYVIDRQLVELQNRRGR